MIYRIENILAKVKLGEPVWADASTMALEWKSYTMHLNDDILVCLSGHMHLKGLG